MGKNHKKKLILSILPEFGCMALAALGMAGLYYSGITRLEMDKCLCYTVFLVLGIGITGFSERCGMLREQLDYDNGIHIVRFWFFYLGGLVVAFACIFLPAEAWPFLPVFVLLAVFSNLNTGVVGAAVLLALTVGMTSSGIEIFALYLISGMAGAVLFQNMKSGFRTRIPFILSMGCLLVCLTAGTVLTANARPSVEQFLVPAVNLIISGILLFVILKYFFAKTVYLHRDKYLELNDSENEVLSRLREQDKAAYMRSMHTAHFCERIAGMHSLNLDAIKCAAYYHCMGEELQQMIADRFFPPEVLLIFEDYFSGKAIRYKETAVLRISDDVICRMQKLENRQAECEQVIDAMFEDYRLKGIFDACNVTVHELQSMRRIFKEEKLYYDFLH